MASALTVHDVTLLAEPHSGAWDGLMLLVLLVHAMVAHPVTEEHCERIIRARRRMIISFTVGQETILARLSSLGQRGQTRRRGPTDKSPVGSGSKW
jgi:hypothetical protein